MEQNPAASAALAEFRQSMDGFGPGKGFVLRTPDLLRILNLPRVRWWERPDLDYLIDLLTWEYLRPDPTCPGHPIQTKDGIICSECGVPLRLNAPQAVLLEAYHDYRGAFGFLGVGQGKTLPSFLAATVLGVERIAIIVPGKLTNPDPKKPSKTSRDFEKLARHWKSPKNYRVFSYQKIGRDGGEELLNEYKPQALALDEVQALKNPGAAQTRKVLRYCYEHKPQVLAMSGSSITRSLRDIHHLLGICLGEEQMPLPVQRSECEVWGKCVDEKVQVRAKAGALMSFLDEGVPPTLSNIRAAVGRRIQETGGVIRTESSAVDIPIVVDYFDIPIPPEIEARLDRMIEGVVVDGVRRHEALNGDVCLPVDIYRHVRTVHCGFYLEWDPKPPQTWLDCRRGWKSFACEVLEQEIEGLDSEMQVANACSWTKCRKCKGEGHLFDHVWVWNGQVVSEEDAERWDLDAVETRGEYIGSCDSCGGTGWKPPRAGFGAGTQKLERWREVRDQYRINSVPRWLHNNALNEILRRARRNSIIWVENTAMGEKLEEMGIPYYREQGFDRRGRFIDDAEGTIAASIAANSEGRNLQKRNHNIIVPPMSNGRVWEQLMGRMHRPGQEADVVLFEVGIGHPKLEEQMRQAIADARYVRTMTGQEQKLLLADHTREF